jgi:hypothetical protein
VLLHKTSFIKPPEEKDNKAEYLISIWEGTEAATGEAIKNLSIKTV